MKSLLNLKKLASIFLMFLTISFYAQDKADVGLDEKLHAEYKAKGIDKALKMYNKSSAKGDDYTGVSEPLNILGYKLMLDDKDLEAAEKVFLAQISEYPNEANPLDSYADLLKEKGEKDKAIEYYGKSAEAAKNIKDENARRSMMLASKAKKAELENKHNAMSFLAGDWNIEGQNFEGGKEGNSWKGRDKFKYNENKTMLTVEHYNSNDQLVGKRIMAYDAINEVFDVAYFSTTQMRGIRTSQIKVEESGEGNYVLVENYTDDNGTNKQAKHKISQLDDSTIKWTIMEETDSGDWEQATVKNFKKSS